MNEPQTRCKIDRDKLEAAMLKAGIGTFGELADRAGVMRMTLYLACRRGCRRSTLIKIAETLSVNAVDLLEDAVVK